MTSLYQPLSVIFYAAAADGVGVPDSPPQAVAGRAVNSTAVAVRWQPPATSSRWVVGYRVVVSPARLDSATAAVPLTAPVETVVPAEDQGSGRRMTVVVGDLDKFTPYTIAVAALSRRGSGPFSDAIVVQTDEDGRREHVTRLTSAVLDPRMRVDVATKQLPATHAQSTRMKLN